MDSTLVAMLVIAGFGTFMITVVMMIESKKKRDAVAQKSSLTTKSGFNADVIHGSSFGKTGIAIDGTAQKFAILNGNISPHILNFKQLTGVEVLRDGHSLTKTNRGSQAVGAAVGAVLLGPAGLLLGGLSGSKTSVDEIQKLSMMVYTNDFTAPVHEIVFFQHLGSGGTKSSDLVSQMNDLNAWHGRMKAILAMSGSFAP